MPSNGPAPAIDAIGIITADRPRYLERCLTTCDHHVRAHGHRPCIIVVDGSRLAAARRTNRQVVARTARRSRVQIAYVGPLEARGILQSALPAGASGPLRQSLSSGSIGANRNLLMLASGGCRLLMMDDDVLCTGWRPEGWSPAISAMGRTDERHWGSFRSRSSAIAAAGGGGADVLSEHAAFLGRAVADGRVVRATFSGLAGDAGISCPYRALFGRRARGASGTAPVNWRLSLRTREAHHIAHTVTLTTSPACMAYTMGLIPLESPPFMPRGRNEDGVFGATLAFTRPDAAFAHLPHGVLHDSPRGSSYPAGAIPSADTTRLSDIFVAALRECQRRHPAPDTIDRTNLLVRLATQLGELNDATFAEWVRCGTLEQVNRTLGMTEAVLEERPDCLQAVRRYQRRLLDAIRRPGFFLPVEFHAVTDGWAAVRAECRLFGELLEIWAGRPMTGAGAPWPDSHGRYRDSRVTGSHCGRPRSAG